MTHTLSLTSALSLALVACLGVLVCVGTGAASASPTAQDFTPVLVSAGSTDYLDSSGQLWLADRPYEPGVGWGYVDGGDSVAFDRRAGAPDLDILGTEDDPLYATGRALMEAYRFDLPRGTYALTLHFAETLPGNVGTGARVFDITVYGQTVLDDFDILRIAVSPNTAATVTLGPLAVGSWPLVVGFLSQTGGPTSAVPVHTGPEVSALEVRTYVPPPTPTPTATPVLPTPTPTPPLLGGLVTPTPAGPTQTPTPTPVEGPEAAHLWFEVLDPVADPVLATIHLSPVDGVSAFVAMVRFPADVLSVEPEAMVAPAGLHWAQAAPGTAVLRGVFSAPVALGGALGRLALSPLSGVRAQPVRLTLADPLLRGTDGSLAKVGLGPAATAYVGLEPWADVNGDGVIDGADAAAVGGAYGTGDERADVDGDGIVGLRDLALVGVAHDR